MKKLIFAVFFIAFLLVVHNLVQNIYSLWQQQNVVTEAKEELLRVKKENTELKAQLSVVGEEGFSEREARDKLLLVKPGEKIVLLPPQQNQETKGEADSSPAWRQWVELFF